MITLTALLLLIALGLAVAAAIGKAPLWVAVLILTVANLLTLGWPR